MLGLNVSDKYASAVNKKIDFGGLFLAVVCRPFSYHASVLRDSKLAILCTEDGLHDYLLLLFCKSSIWSTEKHIFKIIVYIFKFDTSKFDASKCAANYVISFEIYDNFIGQKILKQ